MTIPSASWTLVDDSTVFSGSLVRDSSNYTPGVDLLLDTDGDLDLTAGLQFTTGLQAVQQGIDLRLSNFKGEWFANTNDGIPYFQEILGSKFNKLRVVQIFREALLQTPGVLEILSLDVNFDAGTRILSIAWEVNTDLGELSGELTQ